MFIKINIHPITQIYLAEKIILKIFFKIKGYAKNLKIFLKILSLNKYITKNERNKYCGHPSPRKKINL